MPKKQSSKVTATTVLPSPSNVSADLGSSGITVSWTNNDDSPDGGIDVERSTDGFSTITTVGSSLSPSATSFTDTSVSEGKEYVYRIKRNTDHATATSGTASAQYPITEVASVNAVTSTGTLEVVDGAQAETGAVTSPSSATVDAPATTSADEAVTATAIGQTNAFASANSDETVATTTIGASTTTDSSQARDSATIATTGTSTGTLEAVDGAQAETGAVTSPSSATVDAPASANVTETVTTTFSGASESAENTVALSAPTTTTGVTTPDIDEFISLARPTDVSASLRDSAVSAVDVSWTVTDESTNGTIDVQRGVKVQEYSKSITIDHTQVESDLTDFPVLVHLDGDTDLADRAQSSGDDIRFEDTNGNQLAHEIESFDSATGTLWAHVKVPSVSSSSDTTIYLYYGDSTASNQESVADVWSNGYEAVWHLQDRTESVNGHTLTNGSSAGNGPGVIGTATNFSGRSLRLEDESILQGANTGTISTWATTSSTQWAGIAGHAMQLRERGGGLTLRESNEGYANLIVNGWDDGDSNENGNWLAGETKIDDGTPHHIVGTYDGSDARLYTDGTLEDVLGVTVPNGFETAKVDGQIRIGDYDWFEHNAGPYQFDGPIDEVRIASVKRSQSWISTTYANQDDPLSFYSVGTEQQEGGFVDVATGLSPSTTTFTDTTVGDQTTLTYRVSRNNDGTATSDPTTLGVASASSTRNVTPDATGTASVVANASLETVTGPGTLEAVDGAQAETGAVTSPSSATVDAPTTTSATETLTTTVIGQPDSGASTSVDETVTTTAIGQPDAGASTSVDETVTTTAIGQPDAGASTSVDETVTTTTIGASTTTDSSQARDSATIATTGTPETVDTGLGQVSSVPDSFPDDPFTYVDLNDNFTVDAGDASKFSENSSPSIGAGIDGTDGFVGDGIDDYVTYDEQFAPDWYNGTNVTLSAWFKTSSAPAGIVGNAGAEKATDSNGWVPSLYVGASGKVHTSIFWHGDTRTTKSSNSYDDGEWHHAVATYDDGTETLYVDGEQVAQKTGLSQNDYNNGNYFYYIGACRVASSWPNDNGNTAIYIKHVDEVRVYDRALSANEANTLFNNPTKPKAGPTVTGTTTPDATATTDVVTEASLNAVTGAGTLEAVDGAQAEMGTMSVPSVSTVQLPATTNGSETVTTGRTATPTTSESTSAQTVSTASTETRTSVATNASTQATPTLTTGVGLATALASTTTQSTLTPTTETVTPNAVATGVASPTSLSETFPDDPVLYQDLDGDATGEVGPDGTLIGDPDPAPGVTGKPGSALRFDDDDGSVDYVKVPHEPSQNVENELSISVWTYPTGNSDSFPRLVQKGQNSAYGIYLRGTTPVLRVVNDNSETDFNPKQSLPKDEWTHVVFRYSDSGGFQAYYDGTQVYTADASGAIGNNTSPIRIGTREQTDTSWEGRLDEVRVYDRALSETEVNVLFNNPIRLETGPTVAGAGAPSASETTSVVADASLETVTAAGTLEAADGAQADELGASVSLAGETATETADITTVATAEHSLQSSTRDEAVAAETSRYVSTGTASLTADTIADAKSQTVLSTASLGVRDEYGRAVDNTESNLVGVATTYEAADATQADGLAVTMAPAVRVDVPEQTSASELGGIRATATASQSSPSVGVGFEDGLVEADTTQTPIDKSVTVTASLNSTRAGVDLDLLVNSIIQSGLASAVTPDTQVLSATDTTQAGAASLITRRPSVRADTETARGIVDSKTTANSTATVSTDTKTVTATETATLTVETRPAVTPRESSREKTTLESPVTATTDELIGYNVSPSVSASTNTVTDEQTTVTVTPTQPSPTSQAGAREATRGTVDSNTVSNTVQLQNIELADSTQAFVLRANIASPAATLLSDTTLVREAGTVQSETSASVAERTSVTAESPDAKSTIAENVIDTATSTATATVGSSTVVAASGESTQDEVLSVRSGSSARTVERADSTQTEASVTQTTTETALTTGAPIRESVLGVETVGTPRPTDDTATAAGQSSAKADNTLSFNESASLSAKTNTVTTTQPQAIFDRALNYEVLLETQTATADATGDTVARETAQARAQTTIEVDATQRATESATATVASDVVFIAGRNAARAFTSVIHSPTSSAIGAQAHAFSTSQTEDVESRSALSVSSVGTASGNVQVDTSISSSAGETTQVSESDTMTVESTYVCIEQHVAHVTPTQPTKSITTDASGKAVATVKPAMERPTVYVVSDKGGLFLSPKTTLPVTPLAIERSIAKVSTKVIGQDIELKLLEPFLTERQATTLATASYRSQKTTVEYKRPTTEPVRYWVRTDKDS